MAPLLTVPGGNPVTAAPGLTPRSPRIVDGPVFVTVVPATTAKLAAVPRPTGACAACATPPVATTAAAKLDVTKVTLTNRTNRTAMIWVCPPVQWSNAPMPPDSWPVRRAAKRLRNRSLRLDGAGLGHDSHARPRT